MQRNTWIYCGIILMGFFNGLLAVVFKDMEDFIGQIQQALATEKLITKEEKLLLGQTTESVESFEKIPLNIKNIQEAYALIQDGMKQFNLTENDPRIKFSLNKIQALSKIINIEANFQKEMTITQMADSIEQLATIVASRDLPSTVQVPAEKLTYRILTHMFNSMRKDIALITSDDLFSLALQLDRIRKTSGLEKNNNALFTELTKAYDGISNFLAQKISTPSQQQVPSSLPAGKQPILTPLKVTEKSPAGPVTEMEEPRGQVGYMKPGVGLEYQASTSETARTITTQYPPVQRGTLTEEPGMETAEVLPMIQYTPVRPPRPSRPLTPTPPVKPPKPSVLPDMYVGVAELFAEPVTMQDLNAQLMQLQQQVNMLRAAMPQ